jgi:uncharacterized membrane protein
LCHFWGKYHFFFAVSKAVKWEAEPAKQAFHRSQLVNTTTCIAGSFLVEALIFYIFIMHKLSNDVFFEPYIGAHSLDSQKSKI